MIAIPRVLFLLGSILCLFVPLRSQDAAESPTSTLKGSVQLELATSNETYLAGELMTDINTLFSGLYLHGITNEMEIRLGLDFREELVQVDGMPQRDRLSGYSPLQVGLGWDIIDEKKLRPKITVIEDLFFPFTAGRDLKPEKLGSAIRIVFNHTLNAQTSLLYNLGMQLGFDDTSPIYLYTLSYYRNIGTKFGFYTELFGDFPNGMSPNHFTSLGLFYQLHPRIQVEGILGTGIQSGQDLYLRGRITLTIPNHKQYPN